MNSLGEFDSIPRLIESLLQIRWSTFEEDTRFSINIHIYARVVTWRPENVTWKSHDALEKGEKVAAKIY